MKRDTLLTIAIVVLLVLNIGTLSYLFISRQTHLPPPPHDEFGPMMRPDELIRTTLHLSEAQDEKYSASIVTHHTAMMTLDSEFRVGADRYFQLLRNGNPATGMQDSLLGAIARTQADKAQATYRHFAEIRSFCTPEQVAAFDSIIPDLTRMLLAPHGRGPAGMPPPPPDNMPPPRRR